MSTILLIDDEKDLCRILSKVITDAGYTVFQANRGKEGIERVKNEFPDLIILDLRLPDMSGIEVLKKIKKIEEDLPVLMLTAFGDIGTAVDSMKLGAVDFLNKPISNSELLILIKKLLENRRREAELKYFRSKFEVPGRDRAILGESGVMKKLNNQINKVASTDFTVIIEGESGTGKELIAHMIYSLSKRNNKPFIIVDCGTIPESLIESELFGYERGAFTGADKRKLGYFELSDGGTIFLDEITNLSLPAQAKLLRVLDQKTFFRIGGKSSQKVDVRVIAASNTKIEEEVNKNKFREDLFFRLSQFKIRVPPLRDRKEDIAALADFFLKEANLELTKNISGFNPQVREIFANYSWPGNVREMKNVVKSAALLAGEMISEEHLPSNCRLQDNTVMPTEKGLKKAVEVTEKQLIGRILAKTGGNKSKAAELLGIDRKSLYIKIKKYGLD